MNKVFDGQKGNKEIFSEHVEGLLEKCLKGESADIFCYGQTGSGKTYTLTGQKNAGNGMKVEGILQQSAAYLLDSGANLDLRLCEIHRGKMYNLLEGGDTKTYSSVEHLPPLEYRYPSQKLSVLKLLQDGVNRRNTKTTAMNGDSSRSHLILRVERYQCLNNSCLDIVDLGGSERISESRVDTDGKKDAEYINSSLSNLGIVVRQIIDKQGFVSYSSDPLTIALRNSLSGTSSMLWVANIRLDKEEESVKTLGFASHLKNMPNLTKKKKYHEYAQPYDQGFEDDRLLFYKVQKEFFITSSVYFFTT